MASEDLAKRLKAVRDYFGELQEKEAKVLDISHDGTVTSMKKLYEGKFEDTIDDYQRQEGKLNQKNFVPVYTAEPGYASLSLALVMFKMTPLPLV